MVAAGRLTSLKRSQHICSGRQSPGAGAHEETAGRLEDCLLDTLCAMRALDAARAARGKVGEAAQEAGQSMLRLIRQLHELTENALVS